jgi:TRAP-type C4-dicarboxylate transport system substrate-binding protein
MNRQLRKLALTVAATALALGPLARPAAAEDTKVIKIATLAPEGSSWMKLFHEWAATIEKRSGVKVKFYAGGVAGDERDAVRKMRLGQLNGAAVTAIGLGLIQPEVRVLELPFLFKDADELDWLRTKLAPEFAKKFEDKGYVLLGWGDVGPVNVFTNIPIKSKADLQQTKLWAWVDDPLVRTLFQQLGLNGVPLGVPDVLPALQTGLINACYGSALSTLALQWHSKVKYITSMVLSQSVGAIVMKKEAWDGLSADAKNIITEESKTLQGKLLKMVRADNKTALAKMQQQGLQVVTTPPELVTEFGKEADKMAGKLEGQVYTKEFRQRVEQMIADHRAGKQ